MGRILTFLNLVEEPLDEKSEILSTQLRALRIVMVDIDGYNHQSYYTFIKVATLPLRVS